MQQLYKIAEFVIPGRLGSLNEYINKCRSNPFLSNNYKKQQQSIVAKALQDIQPISDSCYPIHIRYRYYESNKKRDLDNVSSWCHKVAQDTLVNTGIIKNDTMTEISGFSDEFPGIDKDNPRIEVSIYTTNPIK